MFRTRNPLRVTLLNQATSPAWFQPRRNIATLKAEHLQTLTPIAEQLAATKIWSSGRPVKGVKKGKPKGDKARVNIVDEKLCDDILNYLKPSLTRHVGCDLIDLYPGAGLWSRKLHEIVQPRSHILMEPDNELYEPFLEPLLSRPNTTLVPKSGIVWKDLNAVLCKAYLPHQTERPRNETPTRNDTLLVTANLAFFPKKRFRGFESVADLVLFQFISSIRTSSLFQKYGLVRMLVWAGEDEKNGLVPRAVQRRKRSAIDAELSTEWIAEVAGPDAGEYNQVWFMRDRAIDLESTRNVLDRMKERGVEIPQGRETQVVKDVREMGEEGRIITAGEQAASFERPYLVELRGLEEAFERKAFPTTSHKYERLKYLRYLRNWYDRRSNNVLDIILERDAVAAMPATNPTEIEERNKRADAWNARVHQLNNALQLQFLLARDNLHVFRQDPPVMSWDKRQYEPLVARNTEFFPNVSCSLLDIQPKTMHRLFREMGPGTSHSGDIFELVIRGLLQAPKEPVSKVLESVFTGAADGIIPYCPSLRDPEQGGSDMGGYAEISPRTLNEAQLVEILQAWMKWPFAPSYAEFVGRAVDDQGEQGAEEDGGALGSSDMA